jgi:hypothetical protein
VFPGKLAVDVDDENVGGLEIAMDNCLLMRVLHAFARLHEQPKVLTWEQLGNKHCRIPYKTVMHDIGKC